jgi:hypothetical protein
MKISVEKRYGYSLNIEAENVKISEDIESRIYGKTSDGKTNFKDCKSDIKTDVIEQFANVLEDLIYYRKDYFDSSRLIKYLFEKLPDETVKELIKQLIDEYGHDTQH